MSPSDPRPTDARRADERDRDLCLRGREGPFALRAGPLDMEFDPSLAMLRRVRLGRREILRGIYGAVRDPLWTTVGTTVRDLIVEQDEDSFAIRFEADCRGGPVDFVWRGEVAGRADGTLTFAFDGRARSAFRRARIGLCVLHPLHGCAGRPCRIETTDGRSLQGVFPSAIAPHPPFTDLRAIAHEVEAGLWAEVRFAGDAFEMEDQRNWTDASFKTYSTPLRRPFPVEVPAGASVRQDVRLGLIGPRPTPPARRRADDRPRVAHRATGGTRPRLGLGVAHGAPDPAPVELARLKALRPDHLRIDLDLGDPAHLDRLDRAARLALGVCAPLEVALFLGTDPEPRLRTLADRVVGAKPLVASWLVFPDRTGTTPVVGLELARRCLSACAPGARFGVGTNLYFTQVNREPPPIAGADFLAYSLNPQVHAFDERSIVETLDGQAETVRNAARLAGGIPVAVTPVTLRPRFNPHAEGRPLPPGSAPPMAPDDPRQAALFAAAWALGSVRRLAGAGASSLTYYETTGPRGVLSGSEVFPAYHVLADLAEFPGGPLDAGRCSRPLVVESVALGDGERRAVLVANLTPDPRRVALAVDLGAGPRHARILDETTAARAATDPDGFRADAGVEVGDEIELLPYAVARVEAAGGRVGP